MKKIDDLKPISTVLEIQNLKKNWLLNQNKKRELKLYLSKNIHFNFAFLFF